MDKATIFLEDAHLFHTETTDLFCVPGCHSLRNVNLFNYFRFLWSQGFGNATEDFGYILLLEQ